MANKATKRVKKTDLSMTLLLIVGILVVANFLSYRVFFRWDLTENKIYSLSDASKKTMRELDDIVTIKSYFSSTLPSQILNLKQEVEDILNEYQAYSGGKVKLEFIDPQESEEIQRELAIMGIPQLTFEVYEKDKLQLVNGYMGLAISYSDQTEPIAAIKRNTSDLEYQITTAIKKVTIDEIATIGWLTSHSTPDAEGELKAVMQQLEDLYTIERLTLSEETPLISERINTLVIPGPEEPFNEAQLVAINSFVVRGGSLLVLLDGVKIGEGLFASQNNTGLNTLLGEYGIIVYQDLVADVRNAVASFSQGFFTFRSNYSFWPNFTNDGFNKDHSAVANLENVVLPWASSLSVDTSKINEEDFKYLMFTTDQAWRVSDNYNVAPNAANVPQGERGVYNLGVAVNGAIPDPYAKEGEPSQINARLIVVGDSDFITDGFVFNNPDNATLMQNLVDSLSFDEDLINIRSKGVTSRPIKSDLSDSARSTIRYLNIFGLTLIVIAFGLVRYFLRRRSRFIDEF